MGLDMRASEGSHCQWPHARRFGPGTRPTQRTEQTRAAPGRARRLLYYFCLWSSTTELAGGAHAAKKNHALTKVAFPNPLTEPQRCGKIGEGFRICDPDELLHPTELERVNRAIAVASSAPRSRRTSGQSASAPQNRGEGEETDATDAAQADEPAGGGAASTCSGVEVAAFIGEYAPDDADKSCKAVMDSWGVGDSTCNNGVVIFLATKSRQVHICTGKGARDGPAKITDKRAGRIVNMMKPLLREEDYPKALEAACGRIYRYVTADPEVLAEDENSDTDGEIDIYVIGVAAWLLLLCYRAWQTRGLKSNYELCKKELTKLQQQKAEANAKKFKTLQGSCPICLEEFGEDEKILANEEDVVCEDVAEGAQDVAGRNKDNAENEEPLIQEVEPVMVARRRRKSPKEAKEVIAESQETRVTNYDSDDERSDAGSEDGTQDYTFRMNRLRTRYPDYLTTSLVDRWTTGGYVGNPLADVDFVRAQPTVGNSFSSGGADGGSSGLGSSGASWGGGASFGGGSSFGGGGSGGSCVSALHLELLSLYSSTVTEVLALLAPLSFDARLAALTERTLKRSELTSDAEIAKFFQQDGNRPSRLPHLIFVCHKIQGQRTPLVDGKGLYSKFLDAGINLCEIVFFLLDVPSVAYLHRLLSEQPTLNWLFKRKRLIPIFVPTMILNQ
eukprot:g9173.t1